MTATVLVDDDPLVDGGHRAIGLEASAITSGRDAMAVSVTPLHASRAVVPPRKLGSDMATPRAAANRPKLAPEPMLATLAQAPQGEGWAVEQKWDGQRGLAVVDGSVTLFSRNGSDISRTFPEVVAALGPVAAGRGALILDGEIVALDSQGRPCFRQLQRRWPQSRRPSPQLLRAVPVQFFVFDILERDGEDLRGLPYRQRRAVLDEVRLPGKSAQIQIQIPPCWVGLEPDVMLDISREHGLEGIVCKRLDSPYLAGRSAHWIKTPLRRSAEVVIVGWVPGGGPNARTVGSLLVGGHTPDDRRVLLGQVGTGFTAAARHRLFEILAPIERKTPAVSAPLGCPIVGQPHWVKPMYVGTVEYREYRHDGLRHPSWKGLREIPAEAVSLPD